MSALVPESKAFNLIMSCRTRGYLRARSGLAYRVFGRSYQYEEKASPARHPWSDQVQLHGRSWGWAAEWHAGAIEATSWWTTANENTPLEANGVGVASAASARAAPPLVHPELGETVTGPEFDVTLPVATSTDRARCRHQVRQGLVSLYYLLPSGEKNHVIMPCYSEGAVAQQPPRSTNGRCSRDVLARYLAL
jgi:hypothetical protein